MCECQSLPSQIGNSFVRSFSLLRVINGRTWTRTHGLVFYAKLVSKCCFVVGCCGKLEVELAIWLILFYSDIPCGVNFLFILGNCLSQKVKL